MSFEHVVSIGNVISVNGAERSDSFAWCALWSKDDPFIYLWNKNECACARTRKYFIAALANFVFVFIHLLSTKKNSLVAVAVVIVATFKGKKIVISIINFGATQFNRKRN